MSDHETRRLRAAIFRHTMYLPSEQFIPAQARALSATDVVMVARDPITGGVADLRTASLSERGRNGVLRHTILRDPRPLKALLRDLEINILHAHFGVEGMYSIGAARLLGIPHLTTLHGYDVSLSKWALARSGRPAWIQYAGSRGHHLASGSTLVCVSEHVRGRAIDLGAKPSDTVVIGTGVDTVAISYQPLPDGPVVIHVARLVEKKGTSVLISAFARVVQRIPEAELRIVGDGPLLEALKAQVDQLGLESHVIFLGTLSHDAVLEQIAQASLLCLPSVTAVSGDQEGLGQVLLEAGALGRPVVATRHGGIVDGVLHGVTGLLVPERDAASLAEGISALLNDAVASEQMGRAARGFVESNFDIHKQAIKVESLYKSLV